MAFSGGAGPRRRLPAPKVRTAPPRASPPTAPPSEHHNVRADRRGAFPSCGGAPPRLHVGVGSLASRPQLVDKAVDKPLGARAVGRRRGSAFREPEIPGPTREPERVRALRRGRLAAGCHMCKCLKLLLFGPFLDAMGGVP